MRYSMLSAAVLAAISMSAHASATLGSYNFEYEITGDKSVRPVQVFDNGRSLYIQLSARSANPPAVMEKNGDQVTPVPFRYEFPYLVVDGARGELVLALDGRTALVSKRPSSVTSGVATPVMVSSAASPVVGGAAKPVDQYPSAAALPVVGQPVVAASVTPVLAPSVVSPDYSGEMIYRNIRSADPIAILPVSRLGAPIGKPRVVRTSAEEKAVVHTVSPGDTLYRLSMRYGVSVEQIAYDNDIDNPNLIRVGQALVIDSNASIKMVGGVKKAPKISVSCAPKPVKIKHIGAELVQVDDRLVKAVKMAVAKYDKVVIRGHSSAGTQELRAKLANGRAEAMQTQLIAKGVPADRLVVAKSLGYVSKSPRVDIVLIGAIHNA